MVTQETIIYRLVVRNQDCGALLKEILFLAPKTRPKSWPNGCLLSNPVEEWCNDIRTLAEVGKSDPHGAYTAFTFDMVHKWSYFQRTISGCAEVY